MAAEAFGATAKGAPLTDVQKTAKRRADVLARKKEKEREAKAQADRAAAAPLGNAPKIPPWARIGP